MAESRDRLQWTLKHKALDNEFRTLLRKAAERQGMPLMEFVIWALRKSAMEILTGEGPPASPPPARPEDLVDALATRMAEWAEAQERRQAEVLARIERRERMARRRMRG